MSRVLLASPLARGGGGIGAQTRLWAVARKYADAGSVQAAGCLRSRTRRFGDAREGLSRMHRGRSARTPSSLAPFPEVCF